MGSMTGSISKMQDMKQYQELHWTGTFEDYLSIVKENPLVTRTAWQRLYDMIMSYGYDEYTDSKKKVVRYNFFADPLGNGQDAIYGMDVTLMKLVNTFKSAAYGYGTDKRVILLHGPVGSAKSTIVRLIKRGLEAYSKTSDGALYTFDWVWGEGEEGTVYPCPMQEDPLHLIPIDWRGDAIKELGLGEKSDHFPIPVRGELNPACRFRFNMLLERYNGKWEEVIKHVRVRRLVFSEQDRIGIGTFQPKDEKN